MATGLQYYTFTIDGEPVGYVETDESPDQIYQNARFVVGGEKQENEFTGTAFA